ncbi:type IV secretion system protein B4 [Photobacterium frigidiphilum]|uniref:Type IV secretion system protein B4 n=1 Tax=Photobacterium frigidiphilum TaxID=264736 RepID=A0A2T3J7V8_9GAMM|nr:VirB4 family type IV secretion system protein [Photobacterium frigidiphilum]PSU44804.1 type IV secretion system protein B4 [Photobacterium frigidiphilum]
MAYPFNATVRTYGVMDNTVLTTTGSVLGALKLSGIEPASVSDNDRQRITALLRNMFQRLPVDVSVTQYYIHIDKANIHLKPQSNPRVELVSRRRETFLNTRRDLNSSSLYWVIDVPAENNYNSLFSVDLLKNLFNALFDSDARNTLKSAFNHHDSIVLEYQSLKQQINKLWQTLDDIDIRLGFVSLNNTRCSVNELWGLQRALVNLNTDYLHAKQTAPVERWDTLLADGEINVVNMDGVPTLKIEGAKTVYARIASVVGVGGEYMPESAWCADTLNPVLESGNYLYFTRFRPLSRFQRGRLVDSKEQDIYRSQMRATDYMTGNSSVMAIKERINSDSRLKGLMDELDDVRHNADRYGISTSCIVVFDTDVTALNQRVKRLNTVLENADFHLIWESVGLLDSFSNLLVGNIDATLRDSEVNVTQAAAISLPFRSNEGLPRWPLGNREEEAVYIFESDDGVPFHYTPFVGDKCLVIGVGPTRSGKTFAKNCIATHFAKLGGMYCAMDIDAGTEPIARFFGDDGAIFCLKDASTTQGFNPFSMANDEHDDRFKSHMSGLIRLMLRLNESPALQTLTANEQIEINEAIVKVLRITNPALRNFSGLLGHCSRGVQQKLAQFRRGGTYGNLFDNDIDAVGVLDKPYSVYNVEGVKDSPALQELVNAEIFFRAVRLFENPTHRERPKFLEIDECQYVLARKGAAEFLVAKARTWFKWGGGMGFWTQSPKHYSNLKEWSTLMAAATTFIFMADDNMVKAEYLHAFPFLTDDDCHTIAGLKKKQKMYIIQSDIGVRKVVNLHVESEQYVIATSNPYEASVANRIYAEETDIDVAVSRICQTLNKEETR